MRVPFTILAVLGAAALVGGQFPEYDVLVSISNAVVTEDANGGVTAVFKVSLSAPAPNNKSVAVNWHTENVTTAEGEDYQSQLNVLRFPPGVTTTEITIYIFPDSVPEATEVFFVYLTSAVNAEIGDGLGHGIIRDPTGPRFNAKVDVNRNGRSDLIVQYDEAGPYGHTWEHRTWSIDGTGGTPVPQPSPSPAPPPPSYSLVPRGNYPVALDDLDGDGSLDVLSKEAEGPYYWLNEVRLEVEPPGQLVGTGDFNSDGAVDELFWDGRKLTLWESGPYFPGTPRDVQDRGGDDSWQPVAVARVTDDPDRKPELLWQHATDKTLEYWHMRWEIRGNPPVPKLVPAYDGLLQPSLPPSDNGISWDLAATGDFDGDGRDDLLFHNPVTRKLAVWFMRNGARRTNRAIPLSPDTFDRYRPDGTVIPWRIIAPR